METTRPVLSILLTVGLLASPVSATDFASLTAATSAERQVSPVATFPQQTAWTSRSPASTAGWRSRWAMADLSAIEVRLAASSYGAVFSVENRGRVSSPAFLAAVHLRSTTLHRQQRLLVGLVEVPALRPQQTRELAVLLAVPALLEDTVYQLEVTADPLADVRDANRRNNTRLGELLNQPRLDAFPLQDHRFGDFEWSFGEIYGAIAAGRAPFAATWHVSVDDLADALDVPISADLTRLNVPALLAAAQIAEQAMLGDTTRDAAFWQRVDVLGGDLLAFDRALVERFRERFDAPYSAFPRANAFELTQLQARYQPAGAKAWVALAHAKGDPASVAMKDRGDSYQLTGAVEAKGKSKSSNADPKTGTATAPANLDRDKADRLRELVGVPADVCPTCDFKTLSERSQLIQQLGGDPTHASDWAENPANLFRKLADIPATVAPDASLLKLIQGAELIQWGGGDLTQPEHWDKVFDPTIAPGELFEIFNPCKGRECASDGSETGAGQDGDPREDGTLLDDAPPKPEPIDVPGGDAGTSGSSESSGGNGSSGSSGSSDSSDSDSGDDAGDDEEEEESEGEEEGEEEEEGEDGEGEGDETPDDSPSTETSTICITIAGTKYCHESKVIWDEGTVQPDEGDTCADELGQRVPCPEVTLERDPVADWKTACQAQGGLMTEGGSQSCDYVPVERPTGLPEQSPYILVVEDPDGGGGVEGGGPRPGPQPKPVDPPEMIDLSTGGSRVIPEPAPKVSQPGADPRAPFGTPSFGIVR